METAAILNSQEEMPEDNFKDHIKPSSAVSAILLGCLVLDNIKDNSNKNWLQMFNSFKQEDSVS